MSDVYWTSWSPTPRAKPTDRLRGSEKFWVYLRWLAICAWGTSLYSSALALQPIVLLTAVIAIIYCGVVHRLAYRGTTLLCMLSLGADFLVIATLCAVSGGLQSPAYVYFYGIVMAATIRFGFVPGLGWALVSTLLTTGLAFLSPNGEPWLNTTFSSAVYFFSIAGICGMFTYEQQRQHSPSSPERSRAEQLLAFHRILAPLDLDDLLQHAANELTRLIPCRSAGVLLIDSQRKRTDRVAASERFLVPSANELNASLTNGILQQVLEQGSVVLNSVDQIRTLLQTTPQMREWAQDTLVIVRLNAQYPLGCIVLTDKKGGQPFDATDLHLLTLIAEDTATLIEKAWDSEDARNADHSHRDSLRTIISAQEQERRREVEEWHDRLSERLFQVIKDFRACQEVVGQRLPELKDRVEHLAAELDAVAAIGRSFSNELLPSGLDDAGLVEALREYVAGMQEQDAFIVTLQAPSHTPKLSSDTSLTLFRIAQEALRNVRQHAHAQNVHIAFTQEQSGVSLMIKDDGQGFDPACTHDGQYGLFYMRERVEACGGALHVSSVRGQGTEIRVDFPTPENAPPIRLIQSVSNG